MGLEQISDYAANLPGVVEEQPFGPNVDVLKVGGKIFAILSPDSSPESISLKCDPEWAIELRLEYESVIPGYHLNKRLWNTVRLDGSIPDVEVLTMVTHSYDQVVAGLSKSKRQALARSDLDLASSRSTSTDASDDVGRDRSHPVQD